MRLRPRSVRFGPDGWIQNKVRVITGTENRDYNTLKGSIMASAPSEAPPSVYPDSNGMPMLPDLPRLNLGILEEKRLTRRLLTCRSCMYFYTVPRVADLCGCSSCRGNCAILDGS